MAYAYLASPFNIPPLIFRFQFNPDILNMKKSFKYDSANSFGDWGFDKASAGGVGGGVGGVVGAALGALDDIKEWGSILTKVKPIEAKDGEPQTVALDFRLDGSPSAQTLSDTPQLPDANPPTGSIENGIALLQQFMYPSLDVFELFKALAKKKAPCLTRPPEVSLIYGPFTVTGHVQDLSVKIIAFDGNAKPVRADVSLTLKEQSMAFSTIPSLLARLGRAVSYSYSGRSAGEVLKDIGVGVGVVNPFS
jgi:Contractile injection system tube protein